MFPLVPASFGASLLEPATSHTMTDNKQASANRTVSDRPLKTLSSLKPLGHARSLVEEICQRIADDIAAGRLMPGARLPTEQEMMDAMGVSRTVIREAVASLRAG